MIDGINQLPAPIFLPKGRYPLVNYNGKWKITLFLMGKSTISMAIFNCYVSSPEGITGVIFFPSWTPSGSAPIGSSGLGIGTDWSQPAGGTGRICDPGESHFQLKKMLNLVKSDSRMMVNFTFPIFFGAERTTCG